MSLSVGISGLGPKDAIVQRALAILRRPGITANVYTAGLGAINALQAGNYSDSGLTTLAVVDGPVGGVVDGTGVINATQSTAGNRPTLRRGLLNLLTYSNALDNVAWVAQGTASKSGQSLLMPAVGDKAYQISVSSAGTVTIAFVLSGTGTVSIHGFNATNGDMGMQQVTLTATPTIYVITITPTVANSRVYFGRHNAGDTATTVAFGGAGLFQGTLTASQILAEGGIPLTTSAAASNPSAGRYWWGSDGTNDYLDQGSVPFQQADDRAVIVAFNAQGSAAGTIYDISNAAGSPFVCRLQIDAGGLIHTYFRDDALTLVDMSYSVGFNTPVVVSCRVVSGVRVLRVNGVQRATNSTVLGTSTVTTARIGATAITAASVFFNGQISQVLPLKGTFTDADMLVLERFAASVTPNAPSF
jgi:hypothetical protein